MIKSDVSYKSLSEVFENLGGLYITIVPIFLISFSMLSSKWNQSTKVKAKLDQLLHKYLSGKVDDDDDEFPMTLKHRQDEILKLKHILEKDESLMDKFKDKFKMHEGLANVVLDESYEQDMSYFGTIQYYYFIDKFQTIQNKVLLSAEDKIRKQQEEIEGLKAQNLEN